MSPLLGPAVGHLERRLHSPPGAPPCAFLRPGSPCKPQSAPPGRARRPEAPPRALPVRCPLRMIDDRDLGRFAVSGNDWKGQAPHSASLAQVCDLSSASLLQNLLGLAIAVLLIAYNYVTAAPAQRQQ